jgi:hypothetical protein
MSASAAQRVEKLVQGRRVFWGTILVLALAAVVTSVTGGEPDRGGRVPYTPTQGEWLCMNLNMDQALADSEAIATSGVYVRYVYDKSNPDTIQITLVYGPSGTNSELQARAAAAEKHVHDVARLHGWEQWVKVEFKEEKISGGPITEAVDK